MDLDQIESLLKLMQEYQVGQLTYDTESLTLSVSMTPEGVPVVHAPTAPPPPAVAAAPQAPAATPSAPAEAAPAPKGQAVKSPMVGTFYRAPKPGAPVFVEVGTKVQVGQVLCILEAMKLMNELESEVAGTVAEILVDNAQPVQFGQELFRIIPD